MTPRVRRAAPAPRRLHLPALARPHFKHQPVKALAADDKGKAAAKENTDSGLDDDTLKCAICFDLCVRPVTVRGVDNLCGALALQQPNSNVFARCACLGACEGRHKR